MNKELKEMGKQLKEILDKYPSRQKEILFYIFGEDTIRKLVNKPTYEELEQKVNQLEEKEELHLNRIDELTDRVVKSQEKVSQLKKDKLRLAKKLKQLETNRDEAIEYIKNENLRIIDISKEIPELCDRELLSLLERGNE